MRILKLLLLLLLCLLLGGCTAANKEEQAADMRIPLDQLGQTPAFFDWTQAGTSMQLIGLRDADETVRLAFNTCQSCGGSPYAYFEHLGNDLLQCQNCGQIFSTASVGTPRAAGCNPLTLSDFSVVNGQVIIPAAALQQAVPLFKSWKVFE